jgi:hypothetical protein
MNKKRSLLIKTLVVGVLFLFLGFGIQPVFAVRPTSSNNKEDCSICHPVNKQSLFLIESFIHKLETLDNKLSLLSKFNPDVEEIYPKVSERISILHNLIGNGNFCDILGGSLVIFLLIIGISMCKELIIFDIILDIIFGSLFILSFALWYMFCFEEPEYYFINNMHGY